MEIAQLNNLNQYSHDQKQHILFLKQKETLDSFLKTGALSKENYDKSLQTLKEKMNITD